MSEIMKLFVRRGGLSTGVNLQIIFHAWDKVSGAGPYTLRKFFRNGILYCSISSSVVRNQLYFRRDALLSSLNAELASDNLYDKGKGMVKAIVLR